MPRERSPAARRRPGVRSFAWRGALASVAAEVERGGRGLAWSPPRGLAEVPFAPQGDRHRDRDQNHDRDRDQDGPRGGGDLAFRPGPAVLLAPSSVAAPGSAPPAAGSAAHAQAEIAAMAERMVTVFSVGTVGPGGARGHAIRMSLALGRDGGQLGATGTVEVELRLEGEELSICLTPDAKCIVEAKALSRTLEERLGADVTIA